MPSSTSRQRSAKPRGRSAPAPSRKLADYLKPSSSEAGLLLGFLATSYEFDSDFFETDFLPNVLNLGVWDDRNWASRIALEKALAELSAACVIMDASCYRARPRSLRVEFVPAVRPGSGALHAKVLLLRYENEVRLLISSANLTERGFRKNLEVATVISASASSPNEAALLSQALLQLRQAYGQWMTPSADKLLEDVRRQLEDWLPAAETQSNAWTIFGGGTRSVADQFLDCWPGSEAVHKVIIVSPFWSDSAAPLATFLDALAQRNLLTDRSELLLLTEAKPMPDGEVRPVLPSALQALDFSRWNLAATVQAIDSAVTREEAQGRDDLTATRALHAKIVALCGPSNALVYTGSANFTARGWGLSLSPHLANIEAGVVVLRETGGKKWVQGILPRGKGPVIPLPCTESCLIELPESGPEPIPWPAFLRELVLAPSALKPDDLLLRVRLYVSAQPASWALKCIEPEGAEQQYPVLLSVAGSLELDDQVDVVLSSGVLNHLLLTQEVLVEWEGEDGRKFQQVYPLNVDAQARLSLPTAPGSRNPGERALLDYYQGKIAFEDVFPPADLESSVTGVLGEAAISGGVDTSRIQSYVVREFVEALRGIREDLGRATVSEPRMQFALGGPVSPLALGRMIFRSVERRNRTPVAAAFQLVELIRCVRAARDHCAAESLVPVWCKHVDNALAQLADLLSQVKKAHPGEFRKNDWYRQYESVALNGLPEGNRS